MPHIPRSLLVRLLASALALLLGNALFTSSAAAGCGDHVQIGDQPTSVRHHVPLGRPAAPCPCEGPLCSRQHDAPAPAPTSPPTRGLDLDGVLDPALRPGASSSLPLALDPSFRPRPGLATSIFHPPRA